jgi:hypothetical protein
MSGPKLARGMSGRRYVWPPNTDTPEMVVPSVTTILGNLNKPALPNWAAREVAKYAVENIPSWENLPANDAIDLLKRAPYRNMSRRGDVGTAVHAAVEAWINTPGEEPPVVDNLDLLPYIAGAISYLNEHVARVIHTEVTLFNREYQYAGTVDAIVKLKEGGVAIVDWKTSKGVYPEHALQLVAYAGCEFIGFDDGTHTRLPPADSAYVIHLPGDATYKAYPVQLTDRAFRTFCALRSIQKWRDDHEADAFMETLSGPAAN